MRRFQDKPHWCLANRKDGSRCRSRMPLRTKRELTQLLAELAELNKYGNMQECLDKLVAFTLIAVCSHQQDSIIWKLKLLVRACRLKGSTQVISITSDLQTDRDRTVDPPESTLMKHESGLNPARKEERETKTPVIASAIKALQYLPEYRSYHPSKLSPRSVREQVVEQAKEPLFIRDPRPTRRFQELDERKDGYLYVYWNRASFGFVKIGCTTIDVDRRLQQWEDKCQHPAEEHYRSSYRIKHVARVEKLIHTEFGEYRVFEPFCHGCCGSHIEWFSGLNLGLVIKRMEAWTEWIMKEPYEEKLGCWRLKDGLEFELPQICAIPSETKSTKKGNASTARESPRHHLRRRRAPGSSQNPSSPTRS